MAEPTQMLIVSIPTSKPIEDPASQAGKIWQEILELIRSSEGYRRLYWGRQVEKSENVQLHIGEDLLAHSLIHSNAFTISSTTHIHA
jgi:hypothetical protein